MKNEINTMIRPEKNLIVGSKEKFNTIIDRILVDDKEFYQGLTILEYCKGNIAINDYWLFTANTNEEVFALNKEFLTYLEEINLKNNEETMEKRLSNLEVAEKIENEKLLCPKCGATLESCETDLTNIFCPNCDYEWLICEEE